MSLCRGGFFTSFVSGDPGGREVVRADNVAAVPGSGRAGCGCAGPGVRQAGAGSRDLGLARRMAADAIGELVPLAQQLGVRLGIEALHPMFCADRCVIA